MNTDSDSGRSRRYKDSEMSRQRHRNVVPFVLTVVSALVYIGWLVTVTNWNHPWIGSLFLLAELLCLGSVLLWGEMLYSKRIHPREGFPAKGKEPAVDILITVCGEPMSIVRPTLRAVSRIEYPNFKVMVCDDGDNPEVRQLAGELKFSYTARKHRDHAKAGNLNHGLKITSAPFVMSLDADQVPRPEILERMMGFFQVPKIGYVTSKQDFDVPPGDPWGNLDLVFYEEMQKGKNDSNSAISTGSAVVYRREALDSIGGFATWSMVEDLYTSMLLDQKGWHSVYYPFALSRGTAPRDIFDQHQQRWQWAVDSMRIYIWRNPLLASGLSLRQRLNYFHFGYHYLMYGIAYPIFYFLPIWGLFTGYFFLAAPVWLFLCYRIPYLVFMRWMNRSLTEGRQTLKAFQLQAGLWPVYLSAIATALLHPRSRPKYRVTKKLHEDSFVLDRIVALLPNFGVLIGSSAALVYGFQHWDRKHFFLWVNVFWCLWSMFTVSRFTLVALFPNRTNNWGAKAKKGA